MSLQPLLHPALLVVLLVPAVVTAVVLSVRTAHTGRWLVRAGALVSLLALGLGPAVAYETDEEVAVAVEMYFVVDRTGSMAAEDWADGAPRLDGVRDDLHELVAAVPGARYSIIAWSSEATRQLPLTTDARAVGAWAQTVRQEITTYSSGSMVDRPLAELRTALVGAAERNPAHVRLVFFMSDGEQTTPGQPASYESLARLVDGGAVLGYGTGEGGPMRSYDGSLDPDPEAPYITDPSEAEPGDEPPVAISRIDEASLRAVAGQLGIPYVHRTVEADVTAVVAGLDPEETAADGRRTGMAWRLVAWPFALALGGLLVVELWWTVRTWLPVRRPLAAPAEAGAR